MNLSFVRVSSKRFLLVSKDRGQCFKGTTVMFQSLESEARRSLQDLMIRSAKPDGTMEYPSELRVLSKPCSWEDVNGLAEFLLAASLGVDTDKVPLSLAASALEVYWQEFYQRRSVCEAASL